MTSNPVRPMPAGTLRRLAQVTAPTLILSIETLEGGSNHAFALQLLRHLAGDPRNDDDAKRALASAINVLQAALVNALVAAYGQDAAGLASAEARLHEMTAYGLANHPFGPQGGRA